MATTKHGAYAAAIATIISTGANSLANNANTAASSAIDNRTDRHLFHDLTLTIAAQGSARTAGATVGIYIVVALDETNYDDVNEICNRNVATFQLDAVTTARQMTFCDVPIPPALFKYYLRNQTGQALAASGNLLEYRAHSLDSS